MPSLPGCGSIAGARHSETAVKVTDGADKVAFEAAKWLVGYASRLRIPAKEERAVVIAGL